VSNILNIYNENFGTKVVTSGDFVAVSNINSQPYSCNENFARIGEVSLYQKTETEDYNLKKVYKKPISNFNLYYTEQSASFQKTASLSQESSSADFDCSVLTLENSSVVDKQTTYGYDLAISSKYLAVSDTAYTQSIGTTQFNDASVDIFKLFREGDFECDNVSTELFPPEQPFCRIIGSANDGFGKSISISDKYLAISSPYASNNDGRVVIYELSGSCAYTQSQVIYPPIPNSYFGSDISIDKVNQNKLVISNGNSSNNSVFVYFLIGGTWSHQQTLTENTSSNWFYLKNGETKIEQPWYAQSQVDNKFGYSVSISKNNLVIGAPTDLTYYEYSSSFELQQSQSLRTRGAIYHYYLPTSSYEFVLSEKLYGDVNTFKDNMFGYDVDCNDKYVVAGSPKPYFPFSSLYISESVPRFNINFESNNFGGSTFNGQTLLYNIIPNECSDVLNLELATTTPISYRKRVGESFSAFGASVGISNKNVVIGSPIPLNQDMYLTSPYAIDAPGSSSGVFNCGGTTVDEVRYFRMEDVICNCEADNLNTGSASKGTGSIVLAMEHDVVDEIYGKSFIYDFKDFHKNALVGNVFYNNNRFVINNTGSILNDLLKNPVTGYLDDYIYGDYQSQLTFNEKQYICTIEPGEFNISTNPTALSSSVIPYNCSGGDTFDFNNLDLVLRYINQSLTTNKSESWWTTLVEGETQQSIFGFFSSSIQNYNDNRLTNDLICCLSTKNFDVNADGRVSYDDAYMIWNHFIENLTIQNYKTYISDNSNRKNYNDIISFLDGKTGKQNKKYIKDDFFNYNYSSSIDVTGSYLAPYITTVGLYANADLVAIGKIANPIKNNGQIPINIVVKWDT